MKVQGELRVQKVGLYVIWCLWRTQEQGMKDTKVGHEGHKRKGTKDTKGRVQRTQKAWCKGAKGVNVAKVTQGAKPQRVGKVQRHKWCERCKGLKKV